MRKVLRVTLLVLTASLSCGSVEVSTGSKGVSCDLQCTNGGYCALIEGTSEALAHEVQSGHLIQKCVCRPGFTGVACELVVEECSLPERTCLTSGTPCTQNDQGEWGCDCSLADSLSLFAGYQCRKPITEYCSGKYDPDAVLSFCTNGGRCVGDFLAAQVAPGDTAFNRAYQNRGCKCPPEFYGPHCEFLKFSDTDEDSQTNLHESIMENPSRSPYVILVLTLMCVSMVMMVGLVRYKLNAKRVPREITVEGGVVWGDFYTDPRFNGRHRPFCESQNLHVSSVLEDVDLS